MRDSVSAGYRAEGGVRRTLTEKQEQKPDWADINRDLRVLQEVEVEMNGKMTYLRTDLRGVCHTVMQAAGMAAPPTVRE